MVFIKLILGDCLKVLPTIEDNSIDLIVTDPPYNVDLEYPNYNDNQTEEKYLEMLENFLRESYRVLKPKGQIYIKIGKGYIFKLREIGEKVGLKYNDVLIWVTNEYKGRAKGYFWYNSYEPILFMYKDKMKKLNNCYELGIASTNVLKLRSCYRNSLNIYNKKYHIAQMPYEIPYIIIAKTTNVNDVVLDPFLGSGTTLLACKMLKRNGIGIDIDPKAIEIAKKRLNFNSSLDKTIEWIFQNSL
jgi:site-specific DNA-methyltransferase (adenine-specific)